MAKRYSGNGRVILSWDDTRNAYVCTVSDGKGAPYGLTVGQGDKRIAVDSAQAYDQAARAAIAFATDAASAADDGREPLDAGAFAFTPNGYYVGRDKAHAWPPASIKMEVR